MGPARVYAPKKSRRRHKSLNTRFSSKASGFYATSTTVLSLNIQNIQVVARSSLAQRQNGETCVEWAAAKTIYVYRSHREGDSNITSRFRPEEPS